MTAHTHRLVLGEERDRLDGLLDDAVDEAVELDEDSREYKKTRQYASQVEQRLVGVEHLIDEYGADAEVIVREVRAGALDEVQDRVRDMRDELVGREHVESASTNLFVAQGLVDAPFLPDDHNFEQRCQTVAGLYPQVRDWLEDRVSELSTPDTDFRNGFDARLAARRETSGSETS